MEDLGQDISGSLQGAGGIGGLLSVTKSDGTYFPFADANGNITEYVDTNGTIVAHYEFDPYGNVIVATGDHAGEFTFRFSSKPWDDETGLGYWGYRYYSAGTGRWMGRDPAEEAGGVNPYGFGGNDGVNAVDMLGRWKLPQHRAITDLAYALALVDSGLDVSIIGNVSTEVLDKLKTGNERQDLWNLTDNRRHYNIGHAPFTSAPTAARTTMDTAYENYLDWETGQFLSYVANPNDSNCRDALNSLGHSSHSWQDFYAHAIRRDFLGPTTASGGSENSIRRGWSAFRDGTTGSPDSRGSFWPSTWSSVVEREHPKVQEPITSGLEYTLRYDGAMDFTKGKFETFLSLWWGACECYAKKMWGP